MTTRKLWLGRRGSASHKSNGNGGSSGGGGSADSGGSGGKKEPQGSPPPPPPARPNVWKDSSGEKGSRVIDVHYVVREPWKWVMSKVATDGMLESAAPPELPLAKHQAAGGTNGSASSGPTASARRRNKRSSRSKANASCTLRLEIVNAKTEEVDYAVHGTSSALDGMEDKDELVRTLQRCRCENLNLSPPSVLINWDVTHEECLNVVGESLPVLGQTKAGGKKKDSAADKVAVLKEPMGSQGRGIFFVRTAEEIHKTISEHRERAMEEPEFLDNLIEAKGRIPSWVLQAEIRPCLLIRNRRKFHIRTYVVVLEMLHHEDLVDVVVYNRHEVRIAGASVSEEDDADRDRIAHITNGALSAASERVLLNEVPELKIHDVDDKIERFVAETFGKHLLPDIVRRVYSSSKDEEVGPAGIQVRKFALAGLDLMMTEQGQIYLLEVNVDPAAPSQNTVEFDFKGHLTDFLHDLIDLVIGHPSPNFLRAKDILRANGML